MDLLASFSTDLKHAAKAKQRERELKAGPSATPNSQGKRAMGVVPAISTSPTAPHTAKLKRDSRLGKYFEYDLSKMVNSKGGFLVEDDKEVDEQLRAKEKERERQRAMQKLDPRKAYYSARCACVAYVFRAPYSAVPRPYPEPEVYRMPINRHRPDIQESVRMSCMQFVQE